MYDKRKVAIGAICVYDKATFIAYLMHLFLKRSIRPSNRYLKVTLHHTKDRRLMFRICVKLEIIFVFITGHGLKARRCPMQI